jgi:hypothetical protein
MGLGQGFIAHDVASKVLDSKRAFRTWQAVTISVPTHAPSFYT